MWVFSLKATSAQIRRFPILLHSSLLVIVQLPFGLSIIETERNSHALPKVSITRIALSVSLEGRARVLWMQCSHEDYRKGWGKKQADWNSTFCGNNFFLLNLQFRPAMLMPQGVWKTLTYVNDLLERLKLNFSFCQLKVIISSNKILEHMLMQIYTHHILKTKTKKNKDKAHEFRVAAVVETAGLWSAVCSFIHLLRHSNVSWGSQTWVIWLLIVLHWGM